MRPALRLFPLAFAACVAAALPAAARAQSPAPAPAASEVKDLPLSASERQRFVGKYSVPSPDGGESQIFRVYEQDGKLMGQPGDEQPDQLLYQGENAFRPKEHSQMLITFTVEGDRATVVTARMGERKMEGKRVE